MSDPLTEGNDPLTSDTHSSFKVKGPLNMGRDPFVTDTDPSFRETDPSFDFTN